MIPDESSAELPTIEQMDAILRFLPVFKREGFSAGKVTDDMESDDVVGSSFVEYSAEMRAFHDALYAHNWVVSFDWPSWQDEARRLYEDPAALAEADLETLRKLLTTHARKERFCEGHLRAACASGHLAALLERLAVLRDADAGEI